MTIFDLLFIAVFFATVILLVAAALSAIRGRRRKAFVTLRWLAIFLGVYFGILILVSLFSPRRVLNIGDKQCWDDLCIAVTKVRQVPKTSVNSCLITFELSSRARRRAQRELGLNVYLLDERGRRFDPLPNKDDVPFDVLLQPQAIISATRSFEIPADARNLVLGVSHSGRFPACCIIGEPESLFHKRTVVKLDQ
ncbi:MAG: hypothetical protein AB7P14_25060 [Blastocatellales bacterium]